MTYPFLGWNMFSQVNLTSMDYVLFLNKFNNQTLPEPCAIHECTFLNNQFNKKRIYWNTQLLLTPHQRDLAFRVIKSYINAKNCELILYKRTSKIEADLISSIGTHYEKLDTFSW
jgi:hypothetical protein